MNELLEMIAADIERGGHFDWVADSPNNEYTYSDVDDACEAAAMAVRVVTVMTNEEMAIFVGRLAAQGKL